MTKEKAFQEALNSRIQAYFSQQKNGKFANRTAWLKAIGLLLAFFSLYPIILFAELAAITRWLLVVIWGLISLLLIFNIGHDAVHGAFSRQQWLNKLLSYSFNLVGANAYSWKLKHNEAHHIYTNINGKDHDIEVDPLLRVSPHQPHRSLFKWQHIYWPAVYMCFSLLIIFLVDFQIFIQERKINQSFFQPIKEWVILLVTKLFYISYMLLIPVYVVGFSWKEVLVAFFSLHLINGLLIGLVFQPSHYFEESQFFSEEKVTIANWHVHQLQTTVDISPELQWMSQVLGGLNANVPHHLYPKICHVHYPQLSAIIQEVSAEYHLNYHRKSYWEALKSHVNHLKKLGQPDTI